MCTFLILAYITVTKCTKVECFLAMISLVVMERIVMVMGLTVLDWLLGD